MEYFGVIGFILAAAAYYRIDKLEKELKKRNLLDEHYKSDL